MPAGATILEMGCAAGTAYFAQRYRVVGLNLSLNSLTGAAGPYDACPQADVTAAIPLFRRMRAADPQRYREILIERKGPLGWHMPEENARIFEAHGFRVLCEHGKEKLPIGPAMYDKVQHSWSRVVVTDCEKREGGSPS